MKEILIPLNFTPNPVVYDTEQSFSTADASSAVLAFSTAEPLSGVVASLTIKNISQNANLTTVLIDRIEVSTSPFRYTFVKPLATGDYYGEIILKRNLEAIGSAQFTFGVNSSLSAEVLPHLIQAYSLDDLVEQVEAEVNSLKNAYNVNVESAEARITTKETLITGKENIRALNETQRKANELTRIAQELSRVAAEGDRQETFTTLVDTAVIEQVVVQEVAEKYIEIEATQASRLLSAEQQLADIRYNELHVGVNQPFATIGAAIAYWTTTLLKARTTIYVHPGQYKEKFELDEANISIIGYDKKNTRIWYDLGAYGNEPVRIKGGQVYFANLTVESVFEDIGAATGCYGMHVDRTETTGSSYAASKIIVENCDIISGNHSGVGMGTENDQHVFFINCNVKSSKGAGFLYHSSTINMLNQKLTMINTNCYSVDYFAATFTNPTPNLVGMLIEIINCNFKTDRTESYLIGENQVNYVPSLPLSINSFGNNVKKLNKNWSNQVYQLTADDGSAKTVTDCDTVFSGFFRCDGGTTGLNTPTAQWCSGYAVSYSTSQYVVQYAWTILDGFKMYKRYKTTGAFTPWVLTESPQVTALTDSNGNAINISDLNNATKTGFYQCDGTVTGLNTPTASVYLVETIAYSQATYILQYAWDVLDGFKKYKRSKGTVSWTAWEYIVEA